MIEGGVGFQTSSCIRTKTEIATLRYLFYVQYFLCQYFSVCVFRVCSLSDTVITTAPICLTTMFKCMVVCSHFDKNVACIYNWIQLDALCHTMLQILSYLRSIQISFGQLIEILKLGVMKSRWVCCQHQQGLCAFKQC